MNRNSVMAAAISALLFFFSAVIASAAADNSNVIISQVLYDPLNSESSGEAVELFNPAPTSVNISGWAIATETSPTDATFPANAVICGGCYFLVADMNWSVGKDNASWPNADYEEGITLANADAGVAIKNSSGAILDALGWGNPASIGSGLFEGTPSSGAASGNSLNRKIANRSYIDTNNNSNDFAETAPDFHNSSSTAAKNSKTGSDISVLIVVSGSAPVISSLSILQDDDTLLPGNQVSPVPNNNKTVSVEATISDENGISDITSAILTFNKTNVTMAKKSDINATAAIYTAAFNLSSQFPAGNYSVTARATDFSGLAGAASANFEYLSLIAVDVDTSSIVFFASPGSTYEVVGDNSSSTTSNITIANAGNTQLDFDIASTNFTSGSSVIEASRLQYSFNGGYANPQFAGNMTNTKARKDVNLNPGSRTGFSLKLNLPSATAPGNYSGMISLVAVNSG